MNGIRRADACDSTDPAEPIGGFHRERKNLYRGTRKELHGFIRCCVEPHFSRSSQYFTNAENAGTERILPLIHLILMPMASIVIWRELVMLFWAPIGGWVFWEGMHRGIWFFVVGLAKKLLLADALAGMIDPLFAVR